MNLSVRTAFLLMAAISASSVAPAQVSLGAEPLMEVDSPAAPALIVPATLTVETPTAADPLAPQVDPTNDAIEAPQPVTATGDLSSLVAQMRDTSAGTSELECLAGAIYFESKSEPLNGQLAVGKVISNRSKSKRFPSSYCGVLFQRGQFSFVHGASLPTVPRGSKQWKTAVAIAKIIDQGLKESSVGNALFFHARYVSPGWHLKWVASIGNHIFYR